MNEKKVPRDVPLAVPVAKPAPVTLADVEDVVPFEVAVVVTNPGGTHIDNVKKNRRPGKPQ